MNKTCFALFTLLFVMMFHVSSIQASEIEENIVLTQPASPSSNEAADNFSNDTFLPESQYSEENAASEQVLPRKKNSSLLALESLAGEVKVTTLGTSKNEEERSQSLLDIEIGHSKVSVLGGEKHTTDTRQQTTSSLLAVDLDNQLKAGVFEKQAEKTDTHRRSDGSLASVHLDTPLAGKVDLDIADQKTNETGRKGTLLSIEVKETVVGNVNVDVLKNDGKKSEILHINTKDTPIVKELDMQGGIDKPVRHESKPANSEKQKPDVPTEPSTKTENPLKDERPPHRLEQEHSFIPEQETNIPNGAPELIPPPAVEDSAEKEAPFKKHPGIKPVQLDAEKDEQIPLTESFNDAFVALFPNMTETGNKLLLNKSANPSGQIKNNRQKEDVPYLPQAAMKGALTSGAISSVHTSGSYLNGSISQTDTLTAHLNIIKNIERTAANEALFKIKLLHTKWIKKPPIKPPIDFFSLS